MERNQERARAVRRRRWGHEKIRAVDLFCGGGGSSRGLREACNALGHDLELTAINHWPTAIETHGANEPEARHICARLEAIEPREVVRGGRLDLLIASPECTHHSRARGGRPASDQQRSSAWLVLRWAEACYIPSIIIENVPEFQSWGPLDCHGRPLRQHAGETYRAFLNALRSLDYHVDARILTAADYGDPTTRRRLFILADRRRRPRWPARTHAPAGIAAGESMAPWRGAREVIDWSIPSERIGMRRRPLAAATLHRIETGLQRFGRGSGDPFLVILRNNALARSLDEPAPTVTASGAHFALCSPGLTGAANIEDAAGRNRVHQAADAGFRMLSAHELAQAQGFAREHRFCGTRSDIMRQIGNAVPVGTARALCEATLQ